MGKQGACCMRPRMMRSWREQGLFAMVKDFKDERICREAISGIFKAVSNGRSFESPLNHASMNLRSLGNDITGLDFGLKRGWFPEGTFPCCLLGTMKSSSNWCGAANRHCVKGRVRSLIYPVGRRIMREVSVAKLRRNKRGAQAEMSTCLSLGDDMNEKSGRFGVDPVGAVSMIVNSSSKGASILVWSCGDTTLDVHAM